MKKSGPLLEALNDSDNSLLWDTSLLPDTLATSKKQGKDLLPAASKSSRLTTTTKATAHRSNTVTHSLFTSHVEHHASENRNKPQHLQITTNIEGVEFHLEEDSSSLGSTDVCIDPLQASSRSLDLTDLESGSTHSLQPSTEEMDQPQHHSFSSFSSFSTNPKNQWQIQQRFSQKQQTTKEYTPAQLERLKLAFQWWNIWKQPSKRQMHLHLLTHASPLRSSDIDLLPWVGEDERMVHVPLVTRKMYRLQNQQPASSSKSYSQKRLSVVASPRATSKSPLRPRATLSQTLQSNTYFVGEDEESTQVDSSQMIARTSSRRPHSTGRAIPHGREEEKKKKKHKRRSSLSDVPTEKKKSSKRKDKKSKKSAGLLPEEQNSEIHSALSPRSLVYSERERASSPRRQSSVIEIVKERQRKTSLDTTISSLDETRGRRRPRRQSAHAGTVTAKFLPLVSPDRNRRSSSLKTPRKDRSKKELIPENPSKSHKKKSKSKRRKSTKESPVGDSSVAIFSKSPTTDRDRSTSIRSRREEILIATDVSRSVSPERKRGGSRRRGEKRAGVALNDSTDFTKSPRATKNQLPSSPQRRRKSFNSSTPREDARRRIVTPQKTRGESPRARDSRLDKFHYNAANLEGDKSHDARLDQLSDIPQIPMIPDIAEKTIERSRTPKSDEYVSTAKLPRNAPDQVDHGSSAKKAKKKKNSKKSKRSSARIVSSVNDEAKEEIALFEQETYMVEKASEPEMESPRNRMKSKFYKKDSNNSYTSLGLEELGSPSKRLEEKLEGDRDLQEKSTSMIIRSGRFCNPFRRQRNRSSSRKQGQAKKDSLLQNSWSSATHATDGSASRSGSAPPIREALPSLLGRRKSRRSSL